MENDKNWNELKMKYKWKISRIENEIQVKNIKNGTCGKWNIKNLNILKMKHKWKISKTNRMENGT